MFSTFTYVALAISLIGYPIVKSLKMENVNKRKIVHTLMMIAACSVRDSLPRDSWYREWLMQIFFAILFTVFALYDDVSVYELRKLKKQSPWFFIGAQILGAGSVISLLIHLFRSYTRFDYYLYCQLWVAYAFGDAFSGLVGYNFGKIKIFRSRTLEGTIAFLVAAVVFSSIFSFYLPFWQVLPFLIIQAVGEQLSPPDLDDVVILFLMIGLSLAYGYAM
eukprot:TRINITY_DN2909_c0_g1_i3.p1 TRINITY_DN2909_c0_g1~~TRINITY_DN2909_c0_g1_i3.p1  ORF type:complete len:220 (-),score=36.98 TRINITY_DN2909_c0_g1_i3:223-882(-)